jgi:catechol 2,3-dioxygenase-like lactoylglutathione lyase family enzyme
MARQDSELRGENGSVRLPVTDLDRSTAFYTNTLGLRVAHRAESRALLGDGTSQIYIVLTETGPAAPSPRQAAFRYADRRALAAAFRSIVDAGMAIERAEDEGFREAIYVRDPDNHLIELYHDIPRESWRHIAPDAFGLTQPLDLDALRAAVSDAEPSSVTPPATAPLSDLTRSRLADVRLRLLNLHKVLLDDAKSAYELDRGRVGSNASLLQLVINDPWFAWLHPLSELVVRIDETLQPDAPATESDGGMLLEQIERLLSPAAATEEFAQRYYEALQRQPAVVVAHAEVRRILKQARQDW